MGSKASVVISQNPRPDTDGERLERQLTLALGKRPELAVTVVPHLYDLSANGPGMQALRRAGGELIVFCWLYPRAAYWLLNANGVAGSLGRTSSFREEAIDESSAEHSFERTIWCFDLRHPGRLESYLDEVDAILEVRRGAAADFAEQYDVRWERIEEPTEARWYPVIDYSRCGGCRECLNYCVFGVFGLDPSDHLMVNDRDACRRECRECLHHCASNAILFPDPQNGGGMV